mmetsp:Transcript_7523/g.46249  ORF Transcript_7523/g.46249 Transcript_7523/m.46249 type:complete len:83 (+) Transcript_7523:87-335(+)
MTRTTRTWDPRHPHGSRCVQKRSERMVRRNGAWLTRGTNTTKRHGWRASVLLATERNDAEHETVHEDAGEEASCSSGEESRA